MKNTALYQNIKFDKIPFLHIEVMNLSFYPLHMHKALEFIIVLKGKIHIELCYYEYTMAEGDIFLVNKDTQHLIEKIDDDAIIAAVYMDPQYFSNLSGEFNNSIFIFNTIGPSDFPAMQKYMTDMLHELIQVFFKLRISQTESEQELCVKILFCITNYFRNWHKEGNNDVFSTSVYKDNAIQIKRLNQTIWYIYEHYNEKITLENLAEMSHVSKFYLSHLFKNGIGCSIQDFITKVRFDEAMKLLHGTDLSIEQIAAECGFTSLSFFKKSYSRHVTNHFANTILEERTRLKNKTIVTRKPDIMFLQKSSIKNALSNLLNEHFEDEQAYETKEGLKKIRIDLHKKPIRKLEKEWRNISIFDINNIFSPQYLSQLEYVMNNLDFDNIIINFNDLHEFYKKNNNWGFLSGLLFLLKDTGIKILLAENHDYNTIPFDSFSLFIKNNDYHIECSFIDTEDLSYIKADTIAGYFSVCLSKRGSIKYLHLDDLLNEQYIRKVGYYALEYMELLSPNIIDTSTNHIATVTSDSVQLIIFKTAEEYKNQLDVELIIKIATTYMCIKQHFIFTRETGKDDVTWKNMGLNKKMSKNLLQSLKYANLPKIIFTPIPQNEHDIYLSLKNCSASIYVFHKLR